MKSQILRKEYWMQTFGGGSFSFTSANESVGVTARAIAHSLARTPRFRGHTGKAWSVAQHTLGVEEIGLSLLNKDHEKIEARPYLLLHDAHEAFTGDIVAPLKFYMKDLLGWDFKEKIEKPIDKYLWQRYLGEEPKPWIVELIRESDLYALKLERDRFMPSKHEWVVDEVKIPKEVKWLPHLKPVQSISRLLNEHFKAAFRDFAHARS